MTEELINQLLLSQRSYLIAPAGCGKTEIIARAVASANSKQLILTHTHAGVHSLRNRLINLRVPYKNYYINTLASWALRIAASYPASSGLDNLKPLGGEWEQVYSAAKTALQNPVIRRVVGITYSGLFVDEYQDCTQSQHQLVLALCEILPTRLLGDPLQGIFAFGANRVIRWSDDVNPNFNRLPDLTIPWRWNRTYPELGRWLSMIRGHLINGVPVDLNDSPVRWVPKDPDNQRKICYQKSRENGSIVAIHSIANRAHHLSRQLRGIYQSMEETECRDLLTWAENLDNAVGIDRALIALQGTTQCWTSVSTQLRTIIQGLERGRIARSNKYPHIPKLISTILLSPDTLLLINLMQAASNVDEAILYRNELWTAMINCLDTFNSGQFSSLSETAWVIRNRSRRYGRSVEYRTISITLLTRVQNFPTQLF